MPLDRTHSNTGTLQSVVSDSSTVAPRPSASAKPGFFKRKLNNVLGVPNPDAVDSLVLEGFGEDAVRDALKYCKGDVGFARRIVVHERDHTACDESCFICRAGGLKGLRKSNEKGTTGTSLTGMAYG
ncbi:hypothetical protein Q8F55_008964 [Vanrija albida]|uniref:UBA domain-containing protein n=1 Tax=Vanrija albida TaxID=181172 RepID=A0ABR3PSI4_9TREE